MDKNDNREGSTRQLKNGSWECITQAKYLNPKTANPKRFKRTAKTEKEARRLSIMARDAWEKEYERGKDIKVDKKKTFGEYMDEYIETEVKPTVAGSTYHSYVNTIKLYSLQSEFNQRADSIEMSVSKKQDIGATAVRYIRDWLDGNNVDNKNYWGEINVITHDGENVLDSSLIRLQAKNEALSTIMINNIERIKDGTLSSYTIDSDGTTVYHYSEDDYVINTGKTCIEIDLGQIYNDIDYIRIWHRFADGKFVFNHKLQTSIDGVTWVTLYDSSVTGGYEESVDGKLYYLNESNIISSMNKLSMTLNETRSQLSDTSGNLSTLTQTVKGINETVSKNYEDANSALEKLREDLNAKISETEKALASFKVEAGNIYATAESGVPVLPAMDY